MARVFFITTEGDPGTDSDITMTAHDAALTNWTLSRAAVAATETSTGGTEPGASVNGSRTPVLQAALVDSALEELGALLSRDGTNSPSNRPKVKDGRSFT